MAPRAPLHAVDVAIGCAGAVLAPELLVTAQRLFATGLLDLDLLASLALLAAGAQGVPLVGLVVLISRLLVRWSHSEGPASKPPRAGDNIGILFVVTFGLAFLGVFALLYASFFVPLVVLAVVARLFYRPLSRNAPRARATWRILSVSSLGFGAICLAFTMPLR